MNSVKAIGLKLVSTFGFTVLALLSRHLGQKYPVGQVAFSRAMVGLVVVALIYAWRGELAGAWRTRRLGAHLVRGSVAAMATFCFIGAFSRLPVVDATAITFLSPLVTMMLSPLLLKERVPIYRWSAVTVGFSGVLLMLAPYLGVTDRVVTASVVVGLILALLNAFGAGFAPIQIRRLSETESTASIVIYFSLFVAAISLLTLPFGWLMPLGPADWIAFLALGLTGALAQILHTMSYRYGAPSLLATFEYTAMIWAFILGYAFFAEIPGAFVAAGSLIVTGAGLFVIWRERDRPAGESGGPGAAEAVELAIATAETMAAVKKP